MNDIVVGSTVYERGDIFDEDSVYAILVTKRNIDYVKSNFNKIFFKNAIDAHNASVINDFQIEYALIEGTSRKCKKSDILM